MENVLLQCHAEIRAGCSQSSLTPTFAYRPIMEAVGCVLARQTSLNSYVWSDENSVKDLTYIKVSDSIFFFPYFKPRLETSDSPYT
jgi:hypothetical protein